MASRAASRAASRSPIATPRARTASSHSERSERTNSAVRRMRSSRPASGSCSGIAFDMGSGGRRERGFSLVYQRAERGWIVHGHVGQHFAIQIDAGLLQPVHETAVGDLGLLAGGADTHDPQRAEVALLEPAAFVAVAQRLLHRFLGGTVQLALGEEKTLGYGECLTTTVATLSTTSYSLYG